MGVGPLRPPFKIGTAFSPGRQDLAARGVAPDGMGVASRQPAFEAGNSGLYFSYYVLLYWFTTSNIKTKKYFSLNRKKPIVTVGDFG